MDIYTLIMGGSIVFFIVFILLSIGAYVLKCIGLHKLATNRGMDNAWLSLVPIADLYIVGNLAEPFSIMEYDIKNAGLIAAFGGLIVSALAAVPVVGTILWLAYMAFLAFVFYNMFLKLIPDSAILHTVLSVIGFFWLSIYLVRDK